MFTTGLKNLKKLIKRLILFIDEALLKNKRTIVQYIMAILLRSKPYGFKQEDITKEIERIFTN